MHRRHHHPDSRSRRRPAAALVVAALATLTASLSADAETVERRQLAMGTLLTVRVDAEDRAAALAASEQVFAAVHDAESRLSTWRDDSELARLLAAPPGQAVGISAALAADLDAVAHCHRLTGGAFDPSVGALVAAWGLRSGGRRPGDSELRTARAAVGLGALRWTATQATRLDAELRLDEGGFGKGAALDDALATLAENAGVGLAVLDFGGQLAVHRAAARNAAVRTEPAGVEIRIAHPDDRHRAAASFPVEAGSVATTGNGERGVVVDGERLGHVLDPRSGLPAPDFGSLTVWTGPWLPASATLADCLATGLYVLGPDAALDFAARHDGVEVVVARRSAAGVEITASSGVRGLRKLDSRDPAVPMVGSAETTRDGEPSAPTHGSPSH